MNIGILLIVLAFAAGVISTVAFFMAARGREEAARLGRTSYLYFTVLVLLASLLLLYYFLVGDYSFRYVFEYSSSDLPLFYLISAFWGGQQGTYLLWLALLSVFGYYILSRGRQYTNYAMFFYGLVAMFFNVMLLVLSPFEKLPVAQPEGAGLNPLLIDPWMVIHPPVMFVGYAVVAIPFAVVLAALVKNHYKDWVRVVFPAAALAAAALAAGNIMGAFWSYKTLGWGGYWAWDPVENSSLVPWMISLALIHGLLIERNSGRLRRTNLLLSLFMCLSVVYGTFLTRSGVLADFSVHSFVDLGANQLLVGFMLSMIALSLAAFFFRFADIKGPAVSMAATSRQFALLVSMWILLLIAVFILAGTSWPLITGLTGNPGAVDTSVYTRITFPLAIVMGVFLGLAPFMAWKGSRASTLVKRLIPSLIGAVVATVIARAVGVSTLSYLVFVFTVSLAMWSNVIAVIAAMKNGLGQTGAQITHFGLALMLIGILGSSAYSTSQKVVIERDATVAAYDLDMTYRGMARDITTPENELILDVADGNASYQARPKLFWSMRLDGFMKKPFIKRHLLYDFYFAPEQIQDMAGDEGLVIMRGETEVVGQYSITFDGFDQQAHGDTTAMRFGAILTVADSSGNSQTIVPTQVFEAGMSLQYEDVPLTAGLEEYTVRLDKIFADDGSVRIRIDGLTSAGPPDRLILEVSKKPTMNILWAGTILLVLGTVVALGNRWSLSR